MEKLYRFDELPEDVKAQAIDRYRYTVTSGVMDSSVIDEFIEEARKIGVHVDRGYMTVVVADRAGRFTVDRGGFTIDLNRAVDKERLSGCEYYYELECITRYIGAVRLEFPFEYWALTSDNAFRLTVHADERCRERAYRVLEEALGRVMYDFTHLCLKYHKLLEEEFYRTHSDEAVAEILRDYLFDEDGYIVDDGDSHDTDNE